MKDIISYTNKKFGKKQVHKYTSELNLCFDNLAVQKGLIKQFKIKSHQIQVKRCKKHYIFALLRTDLPILIIAIFHERMDLMQRIENRLR